VTDWGHLASAATSPARQASKLSRAALETLVNCSGQNGASNRLHQLWRPHLRPDDRRALARPGDLRRLPITRNDTQPRRRTTASTRLDALVDRASDQGVLPHYWPSRPDHPGPDCFLLPGTDLIFARRTPRKSTSSEYTRPAYSAGEIKPKRRLHLRATFPATST